MTVGAEMLKTMATKNIGFWQLSFVGVAILILLILASGTANADATAVDITCFCRQR